MTTGTRNSQRFARRTVGVAAVAAFALVALATTAWACTTIHGKIKVCSPSTGTCSTATVDQQTNDGTGAPGSVIKVTGSGIKVKPATYSLYYTPPVAGGGTGGDTGCHGATKILKNPSGGLLDQMKTNKNGEIDKDLTLAGVQPYKAVIPAGAGAGEAGICAREKYPVPEQSATGHASFTIIGGA